MTRTLTKQEFEERAHIETRYECHQDEYGDSCGFYSEYLDYHYQCYLDGTLYTELPRDEDDEQ